MNGAALRCHREALGLPVAAAATLLDTTTYKLQQIEMQDHPVPTALSRRMAMVLAETIRHLHAIVFQDTTDPIIVYRSNAALWAEHPTTDGLFPVSWHRIVAARASAMTGRPIEYRQ